MHKVELPGEDFGNFNTHVPDMVRNVTEEPATRSGVRSTLKNRRPWENDGRRGENRRHRSCCGEEKLKITC